MLAHLRKRFANLWGTFRTNRRVGVVLLVGALAVHIAFFAGIPLSKTPALPREEPQAFVRVVTTEAAEAAALALQEQSMLLDSAPLFLPTKVNHSQSPALLPIPDAAPLFKDYPPRITLNAETLLPPSPWRAETPATLSQGVRGNLLAVGLSAPMQLWQQPALLAVQPARGYCEIRNADTGELRLMLPWPDEILSHPAVGELRQPAQFQLLVHQRSLVALPLVLRGSGSDNLDLLLLQFLQRPSLAGQLANGYYTVVAGG